MADYISREAVVKYLEYCSGGYDYIETEKEGAINGIKAIPPADVRPVVRAHWIDTAPINEETMKPLIVKGPHLKCSNCGIIEIFQRKYCPECGAEMRAANDRPYVGTDSSTPLRSAQNDGRDGGHVPYDGGEGD